MWFRSLKNKELSYWGPDPRDARKVEEGSGGAAGKDQLIKCGCAVVPGYTPALTRPGCEHVHSHHSNPVFMALWISSDRSPAALAEIHQGENCTAPVRVPGPPECQEVPGDGGCSIQGKEVEVEVLLDWGPEEEARVRWRSCRCTVFGINWMGDTTGTRMEFGSNGCRAGCGAHGEKDVFIS